MANPDSRQRRPDRFWIVRHDESCGNVARDIAHAARLPRIDTLGRDVDVPLEAEGAPVTAETDAPRAAR